MIKFRFHRGTLQESLATQKEYDNVQQIFERIDRFSPFLMKPLEVLESKFYCHDIRISEDVYILTCEHGVIGFTDKQI